MLFGRPLVYITKRSWSWSWNAKSWSWSWTLSLVLVLVLKLRSWSWKNVLITSLIKPECALCSDANPRRLFIRFHIKVIFIMPAPRVWGTKRRWPSSVCLSVPCLNLSREWKGVASWNWQEGSPWHGDPWRHLEVERWRSLGRLMLRPKMRHIFWRGDRRTLNIVQGWSTMICITDMRGDLKGQMSRL